MSAERDRGGDRTPGTTEDSQTPADGGRAGRDPNSWRPRSANS